ncbi:MAG: hypothetical protein NTZ34_03490 [Chloroflexi bacterium]|nr:hypothetical protein [Chloroflexota bacterium]
MLTNIKSTIKEFLKNYKLNRIAWLQKHGSVYFPFWDMIFKYPPLAIFNAVLRAKSDVSNSCIIHTIGDSHVKPFIYQWPFHVHHISQATAYNLVKEGSFTKSSMFLKLFLSKINPKRDVVLLVFGEIDARVHIYLQYGKSGKTISLDTLIDTTVERYGQAILKLKDEGFAVCVHGIPPAASKEFITARTRCTATAVLYRLHAKRSWKRLKTVRSLGSFATDSRLSSDRCCWFLYWLLFCLVLWVSYPPDAVPAI